MSCPPGQLCLNNSHMVIFIALLLLSVYIVYNFNISKSSGKNVVNKIDNNYLDELKKNLNINIDIPPPERDPDYDNVFFKRVTHPLYPPEKTYDPGVPPPLPIQTRFRRGAVPGIPINIRTRGGPGDYQQMGIIFSGNTRLPLFGRQTYRGSNQWNYYTSTDSNQSIKLPININNKKCDGDNGCQEINNGDSVKVLTYNDDFKAEIYSNDGPRYIPYVY